MRDNEVRAQLEQHHEDAFGWALSCCGWDRPLAEDVLQTAYLKVLDGRAAFAGRSSLKTWLFSVIRLTASEQRRRAAVRRLLPLTALKDREDRNAVPPVEALARSERSEKLLAALNELPEQTVFPDLGDQASAEIDRNFMLRLRGRERKLLKKIEEALERITLNTFGICDKCGEDINIKRLEARPVTTMCIDCKTLQEEEEKLMEK